MIADDLSRPPDRVAADPSPSRSITFALFRQDGDAPFEIIARIPFGPGGATVTG